MSSHGWLAAAVVVVVSLLLIMTLIPLMPLMIPMMLVMMLVLLVMDADEMVRNVLLRTGRCSPGSPMEIPDVPMFGASLDP